MMGLIYPGVCIQARVNHDSIDEIIDHSGDAVDTSKPFVEAGADPAQSLTPPTSRMPAQIVRLA